MTKAWMICGELIPWIDCVSAQAGRQSDGTATYSVRFLVRMGLLTPVIVDFVRSVTTR